MSLPIKPYIESAADKGVPIAKHVPHKVDEAGVSAALSEDEDIFQNIDRRLNVLMARANRIESALNKLNEENNQRDDNMLDMDTTDMGFDENLALNINPEGEEEDEEGDELEKNLEYLGNFADDPDTSEYDIDGADFLDDEPLENAEDGLVESFESKINLNVHDD